jgi:DNA-binding NarL/FixJ family response regulator
MDDVVRIVLADDHPITLYGLEQLLSHESGMAVVGTASNGMQAFNLIRTVAPDVAVLDIRMPQLDGISLAKRLAVEHPEVRVVLLTGLESELHLNKALAVGVHGYVLKRSAPIHLVQAIHVAAKAGRYIDPSLAGEMLNAGHADRQPEDGSRHSGLTSHENKVLKLSARGYTNKEIAHRLTMNVKTVETFRARGMIKIRLRSRADLVRFALQHKWFDDVEWGDA